MGARITPWIFTALFLVELVVDQRPTTASRKTPTQFGARLASGALCGAVVAASASWKIGLVVGILGAIIGTLGGAEFRRRLAASFRRDRPAALIEDAIAIGGAVLIVAVLA
jgi:uncharacterized membrane protein